KMSLVRSCSAHLIGGRGGEATAADLRLRSGAAPSSRHAGGEVPRVDHAEVLRRAAHGHVQVAGAVGVDELGRLHGHARLELESLRVLPSYHRYLPVPAR